MTNSKFVDSANVSKIDSKIRGTALSCSLGGPDWILEKNFFTCRVTQHGCHLCRKVVEFHLEKELIKSHS